MNEISEGGVSCEPLAVNALCGWEWVHQQCPSRGLTPSYKGSSVTVILVFLTYFNSFF
jgi:hypothetical protein